MQFEHFSKELSPAEIEQLEELKQAIETAISDGRLSHSEVEQIKARAFANKKLLPAALQLYRTLVLDEIEQGELEYEW